MSTSSLLEDESRHAEDLYDFSVYMDQVAFISEIRTYRLKIVLGTTDRPVKFPVRNDPSILR